MVGIGIAFNQAIHMCEEKTVFSMEYGILVNLRYQPRGSLILSRDKGL
jgi:hypothetical protein